MKKAKEWALNGATVIATLCAITVTGLRVRAETHPPAPVEAPAFQSVKEWRPYGVAGQRMGPAAAPVTIVEFGDYQCPYCARAVPTLKELRAWHTNDVAVVYRHFPLSSHQFARPAAFAAECAARQGRFEAMHDALYAQADSIGVKSWARFAAEAGVADTAGLVACMADPAVAAAVRRDSAAAAGLDIMATPTFLINDKLVSGHPGFEKLNEYVKGALRAEGRR